MKSNYDVFFVFGKEKKLHQIKFFWAEWGMVEISPRREWGCVIHRGLPPGKDRSPLCFPGRIFSGRSFWPFRDGLDTLSCRVLLN